MTDEAMERTGTPRKYVFILYNLPSEPSRIRVSVWRAMKKTGALNIQQSLWMLPGQYPRAEAAIERVKEIVERGGGSISVVEGEFRYGEEAIVTRFNEERDEEYKELLDYCQRFHEEMRMETERENFTFAELEENEEEFANLVSWHSKIKEGDCFKASKGTIAEEEINKCKDELKVFTQKVYEKSNIGYKG
jgi:hypothetical protein